MKNTNVRACSSATLIILGLLVVISSVGTTEVESEYIIFILSSIIGLFIMCIGLFIAPRNR